MKTVAGCRVAQTLHEDPKTGIYRGWRADSDGGEQSVIVKTLRAAYPLLEDVAQLRHEFEIARALPLSGVVQPLALVDCDNAPALVMEDFGGVSLHDFLKQRGGNGLDLDAVTLKMRWIGPPLKRFGFIFTPRATITSGPLKSGWTASPRWICACRLNRVPWPWWARC